MGEGEIRRNLIEADLVDCMVALPGQIFYSTRIPACPACGSWRRRPRRGAQDGLHTQWVESRGIRLPEGR